MLIKGQYSKSDLSQKNASRIFFNLGRQQALNEQTLKDTDSAIKFNMVQQAQLQQAQMQLTQQLAAVAALSQSMPRNVGMPGGQPALPDNVGLPGGQPALPQDANQPPTGAMPPGGMADQGNMGNMSANMPQPPANVPADQSSIPPY